MNEWLVWSHEHNAWWKANGWGYTTEINEAGRFSLEQAIGICGNANFADQMNESIVPVTTCFPMSEIDK